MKKNKLFYKILIVLTLCSVIFSLCIISASADAPTIGTGSYTTDDKTYYIADSPNHGLPIDVSLFGMKYRPESLSVSNLDKINPLILDNFGVTYAPTFDGAAFIADQYSRNEFGCIPNNDIPWRENYACPRVFAYYDYLDRGGSTSWGDEPVSYRYSAMGLPFFFTQSYGANDDVNTACDRYETYLSSIIDNGILYDGSNLSSQIAYSMQYTMLTSDLSDSNYAPINLSNVILTDSRRANEIYYNVFVSGANVSKNGNETFSFRFTSDDAIIDDLFSSIVITTSADSNYLNSSRLAHCYESASDDAVNAVMLMFDFNELFNTYVDCDIVTGFYISFGLRPLNTSDAPLNSYVAEYDNYPILSANIEYDNVDPKTYISTQEHYLQHVEYSLSGDVVLDDDFSLVSWIGSSIGGIFSTDLIGTISLGDILYLVFGIGFLFVVIKFFAGG